MLWQMENTVTNLLITVLQQYVMSATWQFLSPSDHHTHYHKS
jgi:hypothetical protein